jgi:hypothetical protein
VRVAVRIAEDGVNVGVVAHDAHLQP